MPDTDIGQQILHMLLLLKHLLNNVLSQVNTVFISELVS